MLTKKKCKEALEQLDLNCWGCEYACDMSDDKPCVLKEIIGKLIDEHFDNPPLKFEELKEGMWVWDNKYKDYVKFKRYDIDDVVGKLLILSKGYDDEFLRIFRENRYFRKQVE